MATPKNAPVCTIRFCHAPPGYEIPTTTQSEYYAPKGGKRRLVSTGIIWDEAFFLVLYSQILEKNLSVPLHHATLVPGQLGLFPLSV